MHTLAVTLGTTVAAIEQGMSAREFTHWLHWMDAERVGPVFDRVRHAELLAATYNGASTRRGGDKSPWTAADFLPPDGWADAPEPARADDAQATYAAVQRGLQQLEACF